LINSLSSAGVTILVTTHYLDEAEYCHRLALIHAGRLAALGTTGELRSTFAGRPILEVQADDTVAAMRVLDAMNDVEKTSLFGTAVHAVFRNLVEPGAVRQQLHDAGIAVREVAEVPASLEDVFLDVVEKAARS
jgi:ABC-2 type transport system ATP-binding protein